MRRSTGNSRELTAGGRGKGECAGENAKMEVAKLPRWPCQGANTRTKCVAGEGLRIGLLDIILERETGLSRPAILRVRNGKGYTRIALDSTDSSYAPRVTGQRSINERFNRLAMTVNCEYYGVLQIVIRSTRMIHGVVVLQPVSHTATCTP